MPHLFNFAYWRYVMSEKSVSNYTAYVGLDWADSKHDVCIQTPESDKREFAVVPYVQKPWMIGLAAQNLGMVGPLL